MLSFGQSKSRPEQSVNKIRWIERAVLIGKHGLTCFPPPYQGALLRGPQRNLRVFSSLPNHGNIP